MEGKLTPSTAQPWALAILNDELHARVQMQVSEYYIGLDLWIRSKNIESGVITLDPQ